MISSSSSSPVSTTSSESVYDQRQPSTHSSVLSHDGSWRFSSWIHDSELMIKTPTYLWAMNDVVCLLERPKTTLHILICALTWWIMTFLLVKSWLWIKDIDSCTNLCVFLAPFCHGKSWRFCFWNHGSELMIWTLYYSCSNLSSFMVNHDGSVFWNPDSELIISCTNLSFFMINHYVSYSAIMIVNFMIWTLDYLCTRL